MIKRISDGDALNARKKKPKTLNEFPLNVRERLLFIETTLRSFGRINRWDLKDAFGVSDPQASLDLRLYANLAPDNMAYHVNRKCYVVDEDFRPLFDLSPSSASQQTISIVVNGGLDLSPQNGEIVSMTVDAEQLRDFSMLRLVLSVMGRHWQAQQSRHEAVSSEDGPGNLRRLGQ